MAAKSKVSPIGEIIQSIFTKLEGAINPSQEDIESLWKELVGQGGFKHSRPVTIRKKILTVRVDSSGWMQDLTMKKRGILKGLKRRFGKDRISEIHFKIGEF